MDELNKFISGLEAVREEWEDGMFVIKPDVDEDVHTAKERRLSELIGPVAGKPHTGWSRNGQIAVDMRLWARKRLDDVATMMREPLQVFAARAKSDIDYLMHATRTALAFLPLAAVARYVHYERSSEARG